MKITFNGEDIEVSEKVVEPGGIRPKDFLLINETLIRCLERQGNCPIFESNRLVLVYLFESETGVRFSMRDLKGKYTILRRKRVRRI